MRAPSVRTLVIAGAIALLLLSAGGGGWYWYDTQQRRVAAAYAEVMTRAYAAQSPQAPADARARAQHDIERLLARHPSAAPVGEAAYELGNLRYAAGQWAAARSSYEIAAARAHSPTVRALARMSIGYTWEAERDWGKAIATYQAVARDLHPRDFLFDEANFALARAQELAGKPGDAVGTYQRLVREEPTGLRVEEAKQQLLRLSGTATK